METKQNRLWLEKNKANIIYVFLLSHQIIMQSLLKNFILHLLNNCLNKA